MKNKYLAKIIAKDMQGLKLISACCYQAKIRVFELKYLKKSQIFLVFLKRFKQEIVDNKQEVNSVLRFDFIQLVRSKNINQNNKDFKLELLAINLFKNKKNMFEISLIFKNNSYLTLHTEIVEVVLEDQNKI